MDQKPIRKPNWHMIFVLVGGLFCCGAVSSAIAILTLPAFSGGADEAMPTIEQIVESTSTEPPSSVLVANLSTAQPTHTPTQTQTATPTPTNTPTLLPTQDVLQMTVDAVSTDLAEIRAMTRVPTSTPQPTVTQQPAATTTPDYNRLAVVQFDNVTVRTGPSQDYQAVTMAWYGETFGVLDERHTTGFHQHWIRVDHPLHSSAWIAAHLLDVRSNDD